MSSGEPQLHRNRLRVDPVGPRHRLHGGPEIADAAGHRGDHHRAPEQRHRVRRRQVAGRAVGQHPGARHHARRRAQAGQACALGGPADRAAVVGADPQRRQAGGHRGAVAAARAAGGEALIEGVERGPEELVRGVHVEPQLRAVGLAHQHRPGTRQALHRRRAAARHEVAQEAAAGRAPQAGGGQQVLHHERHAVQRADVLSRRQRRVRPGRGGARALLVERDDRVQPRVQLGDPLEVPLEDLQRRQLACLDRESDLARGELEQLGHLAWAARNSAATVSAVAKRAPSFERTCSMKRSRTRERAPQPTASGCSTSVITPPGTRSYM